MSNSREHRWQERQFLPPNAADQQWPGEKGQTPAPDRLRVVCGAQALGLWPLPSTQEEGGLGDTAWLPWGQDGSGSLASLIIKHQGGRGSGGACGFCWCLFCIGMEMRGAGCGWRLQAPPGPGCAERRPVAQKDCSDPHLSRVQRPGSWGLPLPPRSAAH